MRNKNSTKMFQRSTMSFHFNFDWWGFNWPPSTTFSTFSILLCFLNNFSNDLFFSVNFFQKYQHTYVCISPRFVFSILLQGLPATNVSISPLDTLERWFLYFQFGICPVCAEIYVIMYYVCLWCGFTIILVNKIFHFIIGVSDISL